MSPLYHLILWRDFFFFSLWRGHFIIFWFSLFLLRNQRWITSASQKTLGFWFSLSQGFHGVWAVKLSKLDDPMSAYGYLCVSTAWSLLSFFSVWTNLFPSVKNRLAVTVWRSVPPLILKCHFHIQLSGSYLSSINSFSILFPVFQFVVCFCWPNFQVRNPFHLPQPICR